MKCKIFGRILLALAGIFLCAVLVLMIAPVVERVDTTSVEGATDWMAGIEDSRLLSDINLPGTHDSATEYVQLAFFSRCQALNILEQLEAGYRYLDIRLAVEGQKMKLMHGFTNAKTGVFPWSDTLFLEDVLAQCYGFLEEHPSETIVFMAKQEYGNQTTADFQTVLNSYIMENSGYWCLADEIPTLGEARGKLVLMRRYGDDAKLGAAAGISMGWGEPEADGKSEMSRTIAQSDFDSHTLLVQDLYELDTTEKWQAFSYFLDYCEEEDTGAVSINFLSTKGSLTYGHPHYFAKRLNAKLLGTELTAEERYGWIILDFASPALAKHIYDTNFI